MKNQTKRALTAALFAVLLLSASGCGKPAAGGEPRRIPIPISGITDENISIIDDTFVTPCAALVDEPALLPETPEGEPSGTPESKNWEPVKQSAYFPIGCYIDLGGYYYVTDLIVFDRNGSPTWTVQTGIPFQWEEAAVFRLDRYLAWRRFPLTAKKSTRFVRIVCDSGDSGVNELALYGWEDASHD